MILSIIILLFLSLPLSHPEINADQTQEQALLESGLQAEEEGEYEKALEIWVRAKSDLTTPSTEIGANYIRLVTEQKMRRYYEAASAMYLWGLSPDEIGYNRRYLEQELEYLEPLLEDDRRRAWNELLENDDPALYEQIRLWWENLDPTPASAYNERVIEHWERIAYAREHFTRNDNSIYGTDDRGPVYVQYGEPDRKSSGRLEMTKYETERLAGLFDAARSMAVAALSYHENAEYEIWVYNRPNDEMQYNLIALFGEAAGGSYKQLRTVEEFIPSRAFGFSERNEQQTFNINRKQAGMRSTTSSKATAGMIMQWIYYKQLATKDFYFSHLFNQMDFDWIRADRSKPGKYRGEMYHQKHAHVTRENLNAAPKEKSTHEERFPSIPLEIHQYRLLDEMNRPVFATFVDSDPHRSFLEDLVFNQEKMVEDSESLYDTSEFWRAFSHYRIYHGVDIRSREGRRLGGQRLQPPLVLDQSTRQVESGSVFRIPYSSEEAKHVYYAELHNRHPDSQPREVFPFPDHLRGLGKMGVPQPEPLENDPSRLQMGDLIMGYNKEDSTGSGRFLPFEVSHERQITAGELMVLHLEIYHLQQNSEGIADFSVRYEVQEPNGGLFGFLKKYRSNMELTLNLQNDDDRFVEDLEIKTRELEPGDYRLILETTDHVSGQKMSRKMDFSVLESGE